MSFAIHQCSEIEFVEKSLRLNVSDSIWKERSVQSMEASPLCIDYVPENLHSFWENPFEVAPGLLVAILLKLTHLHRQNSICRYFSGIALQKTTPGLLVAVLQKFAHLHLRNIPNAHTPLRDAVLLKSYKNVMAVCANYCTKVLDKKVEFCEFNEFKIGISQQNESK